MAVAEPYFRAKVQEQYDECLHYAQHPELSAPLFGVVGVEAVRTYYTHKAEAYGWVLDKWPEAGNG